jgi:hypothetical protein
MGFNSPNPLPMIDTVQEFLDLLFWKFHRIFDQEGVSAYIPQFSGVTFRAASTLLSTE